jgi:hypothetical protein
MNLDYARRKRADQARQAGRPNDPDDPRSIPLRPLGPNWRTTYPQEFPVTVTSLAERRITREPAIKLLAACLGLTTDSPSMRRLAVVLTAKEQAHAAAREGRCPPEDAQLPARLGDNLTTDPATGEWVWTGNHDRDGYGVIGNQLAHRAVWEELVGEVPAGLVLDHVKTRGCTRRDCCWIPHLEPVTSRVNTLRGESFAAVNAAKEECDNGHQFDLINTYWSPAGRRDCRACIRARVAAYTRRVRAGQPVTRRARLRLAGVARSLSSASASLTAPRTTLAP